MNKSDADIDKFNPYHDSKGRFTTSGGGASFSGTLLHGSPNKGIKEFDISRAGSNTGSGEKLLFFTNDKDLADDFSYERLPGSTKFVNVRGEKGEVYRTKVQMKKPLDFRNLSDDDIKAIKELDADGILSSDDIKMLAGMKNHGSLKAALDLRPEALKRLGYDGIIANTVNGKTEFAVIDSKQTKILNKSFSELEKFNPHHDRLGRFASSGGGIGANAKASERGHVETKSYDESIKTVKQELGCDDKQAKKYAKSVYSFTSENYEAIRAYQSGKKNDYTKKFSRDAKAVEDYIEKAPHWNGGTLYRGINLESGDVKTLFKPGTEMDMKGTSSWSSEKKIADSYTFGSGTKVIFQCDKISKATSVAHLSDTPSEKEVLVSKDTKYISKKVSKKGNVYYVYLDEVTSMAKSFYDIMKFNPYHDRLGRFSSANGAASMTIRTRSKLWQNAADKAIARERERAANEASKPAYLGETDKAVKLKMTVYDIDLEESHDRNVWVPKSQLSEDGVPGQWITNQKAQEFYQSPRSSNSYEAYYTDSNGKKYNASYTAKEKQYAAERENKAKQSKESYAQLVQRAKDLGIKGAKVGWKAQTLRQKIAEAENEKKSLHKSEGDTMSDSTFHIAKADEDQRLVFGWALVASRTDGEQIIDHQGDMVDPDELEKGAYEYVLKFRDAGEEHLKGLRKKAKMVESCVFTPEKMKAIGIPEGTIPVGWWIGFYVDDDDTWEKIKNGTYNMFSIEGKAIREPVNKSDSIAKTFSEILDNI